jgi:hypothetical protein
VFAQCGIFFISRMATAGAAEAFGEQNVGRPLSRGEFEATRRYGAVLCPADNISYALDNNFHVTDRMVRRAYVFLTTVEFLGR